MPPAEGKRFDQDNQMPSTARKIPTERQMLDRLLEGRIAFPPFEITSRLPKRTAGKDSGIDAAVQMRWGRKRYRFAVECKTLSTPKVTADAISRAQRVSQQFGMNPMVYVPYLAPEQLAQLEAQEVSGIDLCGNGVIIVPGEVLVVRTGNPNHYPRSAAIKNIYRGVSSMVARVFLLQPTFDSVSQILAAIKGRGGEITLSTVSKVCKQLAADLIIEQRADEDFKESRFRLLQPGRLIERLVGAYTPPDVSAATLWKLTCPYEGFLEDLNHWSRSAGVRVVMTGCSSTLAYSVMAQDAVPSFYCSDLDRLRAAFAARFEETNRFADVQLQETQDHVVYFDSRERLVASPIQTFVELAHGDKRERETSDQVRDLILRELTPKPGRTISQAAL